MISLGGVTQRDYIQLKRISRLNKFVISNSEGRAKAYMEGNDGSNPVHYIYTHEATTFIEVTGNKNVMATTII